MPSRATAGPTGWTAVATTTNSSGPAATTPSLGGPGGNVLKGDLGQDTASYEWTTIGVSLNLADGFGEVLDPQLRPAIALVAEDELISIENVVGSAANDTIEGEWRRQPPRRRGGQRQRHGRRLAMTPSSPAWAGTR